MEIAGGLMAGTLAASLTAGYVPGGRMDKRSTNAGFSADLKAMGIECAIT
jgi:hypothetical protein